MTTVYRAIVTAVLVLNLPLSAWAFFPDAQQPCDGCIHLHLGDPEKKKKEPEPKQPQEPKPSPKVAPPPEQKPPPEPKPAPGGTPRISIGESNPTNPPRKPTNQPDAGWSRIMISSITDLVSEFALVFDNPTTIVTREAPKVEMWVGGIGAVLDAINTAFDYKTLSDVKDKVIGYQIYCMKPGEKHFIRVTLAPDGTISIIRIPRLLADGIQQEGSRSYDTTIISPKPMRLPLTRIDPKTNPWGPAPMPVPGPPFKVPPNFVPPANAPLLKVFSERMDAVIEHGRERTLNQLAEAERAAAAERKRLADIEDKRNNPTGTKCGRHPKDCIQ